MRPTKRRNDIKTSTSIKILRTSADKRVSQSTIDKISEQRLKPKPTTSKIETVFSDDSFVVISTEDKEEVMSPKR
jgi:hypothetical protein